MTTEIIVQFLDYFLKIHQGVSARYRLHPFIEPLHLFRLYLDIGVTNDYAKELYAATPVADIRVLLFTLSQSSSSRYRLACFRALSATFPNFLAKARQEHGMIQCVETLG